VRADTRLGVLVLASQSLFGAGVVAKLEPPFVVVAVAQSGAQAAQLLARHRPPLSIMVLTPPLSDMTLEAVSVALIEVYSETSTLVLMQNPDYREVRLVYQHGARGIYETTINEEKLLEVLLQIHSGRLAIHPSLARYLTRADLESKVAGTGRQYLRPRERQILQLVAEGYTSSQIGEQLTITTKTVEVTIERAMRRLEARNRTHAVILALRLGLLA
jgi:DNA-binding NarL/FixJ family response regulator